MLLAEVDILIIFFFVLVHPCILFFTYIFLWCCFMTLLHRRRGTRLATQLNSFHPLPVGVRLPSALMALILSFFLRRCLFSPWYHRPLSCRGLVRRCSSAPYNMQLWMLQRLFYFVYFLVHFVSFSCCLNNTFKQTRLFKKKLPRVKSKWNLSFFW